MIRMMTFLCFEAFLFHSSIQSARSFAILSSSLILSTSAELSNEIFTVKKELAEERTNNELNVISNSFLTNCSCVSITPDYSNTPNIPRQIINVVRCMLYLFTFITSLLQSDVFISSFIIYIFLKFSIEHRNKTVRRTDQRIPPQKENWTQSLSLAFN